MSRADSFVSLHNHSHNSLLDGLSTEKEYLEQVEKIGQVGMGITDHGNLFGIYSFLNNTQAHGLKGVPGCEFYVAPENKDGAKAAHAIFYGADNGKSGHDVSGRGAYLHMTVWAYNNEGLKNLFKLSSLAFLPEHNFTKPRIDFSMLEKYNAGLIATTGCPSSEVSTRFLLGQDDKAYEYADKMVSIFGRDRYFVEVMNHNMSETNIEKLLLPRQLKLAQDLNLELLATNDCHYAHSHDAPHHEEMLCIQSGAFMDEKTYNQGGKRFAFDGREYYLKTSEQMFDLFPERDFPRAITNTRKVADMVEKIELNFDNHLRPQPVVPDNFANDQVAYYKHLIKQGLKRRYGDAPREIQQEAIKRSNKEFKVISSSDFVGYMLTVLDYLQWTKDNFSTHAPDGEIVASSIGAGRGCFLPGNMVSLANGENLPIEKIYVDTMRALHTNSTPQHKAHTFDGQPQTIHNAFCYPVANEECVRILLSSGEEITCTADHLIFTLTRGFVPASEVTNSDVLTGHKASNTRSGILFSEVNERRADAWRKSFETVDNTPGAFHSEKTKKDVPYSCAFERLCLNILEADSSVAGFFVQNMTFPDEDGATFDRNVIAVDYVDGTRTIVHAYPDSFVTHRQEYAREVIMSRFFAHHGVRFDAWVKSSVFHELAKRPLYDVVRTERFTYTGNVYDLSVSGVFNYVVSGAVVHNSVGGSIHAFALGISEVDPIKHDLLFERFLSAGRGATYEITYEDGTTEEIIVSATKKVLSDVGDATEKYIHQLNVGDLVEDSDEKS